MLVRASFCFPCVPSLHVLNLRARLAGSLLVRGSILDSIFIPSERAFGGISERNSRAGLERKEKGLKVTRTSVRNRVIMIAGSNGCCEDEEDGLHAVSNELSKPSASTYRQARRRHDVGAIDRIEEVQSRRSPFAWPVP